MMFNMTSNFERKSCAFLVNYLWVAILCISFVVADSAGADGPTQKGPVGAVADGFVQAAPSIAAAVCSDGIAVVACHTAFNDEPLLLFNQDSRSKDGTVKEDAHGAAKQDSDDADGILSDLSSKDLPREYKGPFRIHALDNLGTCLVACGWRADGQLLVDQCRALASNECSIYGRPIDIISHSQIIGMEASLWMARGALSDRYRSLSAVGLLMATEASKTSNSGYLGLIDMTGIHQLTKIALGRSAALINDRLSKTDFQNITVEEGAKQLVAILSNSTDAGDGSETRFEVAALRNGMVKRLFASRLFAVSKRG